MEHSYLVCIDGTDISFELNDPHDAAQIAEFILTQGYSVEMVVVS